MKFGEDHKDPHAIEESTLGPEGKISKTKTYEDLHKALNSMNQLRISHLEDTFPNMHQVSTKGINRMVFAKK